MLNKENKSRIVGIASKRLNNGSEVHYKVARQLYDIGVIDGRILMMQAFGRKSIGLIQNRMHSQSLKDIHREQRKQSYWEKIYNM